MNQARELTPEVVEPGLLIQSGGHDHASLALMPFIASRDQSDRHGSARFAYQVHVDDRIRRIAYTMEAGENGQLPTQYDQPVLLAMLQLWLCDRTPNSPRMAFRRRQVLELLRWPDNGQSYRRLTAGLDRLTQLTIKVDTALIARDGREYGRGHGAYNLIDSFWIGEVRDVECWLHWGSIVQQAQVIGDLKRLDFGLMMSLSDPVAAQLYRVLDRVTMSGSSTWTVTWQTLAQLVGMRPEAYDKPNRFRSRLAPRFEQLVQAGVIDRVDYERGGRFTFHVRNYLRGHLRRVLAQYGVYDEVARQLVAGFDEVRVMVQCDCLQDGNRSKPNALGGFLTDAIRNDYPLSYPPEEPAHFVALQGLYSTAELEGYHQAGLRICGYADDLFASRPDATAWPLELRAVVRFMMRHNLDPDQVATTPPGRGPTRMPDPTLES
jgi:hypothetical protein